MVMVSAVMPVWFANPGQSAAPGASPPSLPGPDAVRSPPVLPLAVSGLLASAVVGPLPALEASTPVSAPAVPSVSPPVVAAPARSTWATSPPEAAVPLAAATVSGAIWLPQAASPIVAVASRTASAVRRGDAAGDVPGDVPGDMPRDMRRGRGGT
ncbi:hypothetical protein GCM10022215_41610 [Nocardioides fonticola]|uniref:Uncharacterized protein n=1 Tax=Nocardioides fonticola TaxID=450363 RepID=A0ABP7Y1K0_9ACTN